MQACKRLHGAKDFLSQARRQIGLAPREIYPGLEIANEAKDSLQHAALPPRDQVKDIDQVLLVLIPNAPQQLATLSQICTHTVKTIPRTLFRGSYRRYCFLQDAQRLLKIGEDFTRLQYYPERAVSLEGKPVVDSLRSKMRSELARVGQLSQGLCWPFHRASQQFFTAWRSVFTEALTQLDRIDAMRGAQHAAAADARRITQALEQTSIVTADASSLPAMTEPKSTSSKNHHNGDCLLKRADAALKKAEELLAETLVEKSTMVLATDFKLSRSSPLQVTPPVSCAEEQEVDISKTYTN